MLEPKKKKKNEHYCRRWISLKTLKEIPDSKESHLFEAQISNYNHTDNSYFVMSSATKDPFRNGYYRSIALGILISPHSQSKIHFLEDASIKRRKVGVTCETCLINDCEERVAQPKNIERKQRFEKMEQSVEEIRTDISVIKTALIGNELSNDKGLVGGLVVVKAEIELLKAEVKQLTEDKIKNSIYIRLITWLSAIIGTGVIGFVLKYLFQIKE